jgi:hypothetical protein
MLAQRTFIIVPVTGEHPVCSGSEADGIVVRYEGKEVIVRLQGAS